MASIVHHFKAAHSTTFDTRSIHTKIICSWSRSSLVRGFNVHLNKWTPGWVREQHTIMW